MSREHDAHETPHRRPRAGPGEVPVIGLLALLLAAAPPAHAEPDAPDVDAPVAVAAPAPVDPTAPLATGAHAPDDVAVVIGIEDYTHWPKAPHAVADAEAMAGWLVETRGVPEDRVHVLTVGVTMADVDIALRKAVSAVGAEGTVWLYYAGHGAWSRDGDERLLVGEDTPADPLRVDSYGVKLSEVRRLLGAAKRPALLILETSFAGTGRDGADLPAPDAPDKVSYGVPVDGVFEWYGSAPKGRTFLAPSGDHGAFTWYALAALRGWADTGDGAVDAAEAELWVREAMHVAGVGQGSALVLLSPIGWPELPAHEAPPAAPEPADPVGEPEPVDTDGVTETVSEPEPVPDAVPDGPPAWIGAGSGLAVVEGRRVLRGVAKATGHRFLMDARKAGRPAASAELERIIELYLAQLALVYGRSPEGADPGSVTAEITDTGRSFVAMRQRLIDVVDGEHLVWKGRPDDAYWAMAELDLDELRRYVAQHADVGPWTREWMLEHLEPVFDAMLAE